MAQLVEHVIGNDEVISSTLIASSKNTVYLIRDVPYSFLHIEKTTGNISSARWFDFLFLVIDNRSYGESPNSFAAAVRL